jgi:low temperature requirement protein LtrA
VLVGGYAGGAAQYVLWGLAILLDVWAAAVGGKLEGWNLHAAHFAERHALFVIIALGECLIVTAGGVTGDGWSPERMLLAPMAVAVTCALWWSYFTRAKPELERALEAARGAAQSTMARDAFSLIHFPMLCGVIAYGAGVSHAISQPSGPLSLVWRGTVALGVLLFVGGMALAIRRATGHLLVARSVLMLVTAFAILAAEVPPLYTLAIAFAGVTAACVLEQRMRLPLEVGAPPG